MFLHKHSEFSDTIMHFLLNLKPDISYFYTIKKLESSALCQCMLSMSDSALILQVYTNCYKTCSDRQESRPVIKGNPFPIFWLSGSLHMGYPFASNEMVSSLAFSPSKAGLPNIISKAHSEVIIKECMLQSLQTQGDLMDPDLSSFRAVLEVNIHRHRWLRVFNLERDSLQLLRKSFGQIFSIILCVSNSYRFELKFI